MTMEWLFQSANKITPCIKSMIDRLNRANLCPSSFVCLTSGCTTTIPRFKFDAYAYELMWKRVINMTVDCF